MFTATIQAFLASTGYQYDGTGIEAALARIEDWYVGDGWYSDGEGRRFDHYNAWTFHLYPFFILEMLGEDDSTGRRQVYRQRLGQFVHGYSHLFGADGAPLIQGRSLIYRWGVVAPFWMALREGVTAVPPGQVRRLASGTLKYFLEAGAAPDGVLELGWHGANPSILQSYNAPGSPQWAAKGFLGLLLPPDHPAWTDVEKPLPVEVTDFALPLKGPRWLAVGTRNTGTVRALNAGSDGHPQTDSALYRRLAFSTATVPVLEQNSHARDNDVYVPGPGGISRHRGLLGGSVRPSGGSSTFALDANGRDVTVQTSFAVLDGVEVRAVKLTGVIGLSPEVSGYLMSAQQELGATLCDVGGAVEGRPGRSGATTAQVSSLLLLDSSERPEVRVVQGGPTILGTHSAMPVLAWQAQPANELRALYLVGLDASPATLEQMAQRLQWQWCPEGIQIRFGARHVVMPWQRDTSWPAERINQGVFRWEPPRG